MARYYHMTVQPTLFGEWSVVREWGRIGRGGQVCILSYSAADAAFQAMDSIEQKKRRRGYRVLS
eukprot:gene433-496_t